jgi:hypothetical protein
MVAQIIGREAVSPEFLEVVCEDEKGNPVVLNIA